MENQVYLTVKCESSCEKREEKVKIKNFRISHKLLPEVLFSSQNYSFSK